MNLDFGQQKKAKESFFLGGGGGGGFWKQIKKSTISWLHILRSWPF